MVKDFLDIQCNMYDKGVAESCLLILMNLNMATAMFKIDFLHPVLNPFSSLYTFISWQVWYAFQVFPLERRTVLQRLKKFFKFFTQETLLKIFYWLFSNKNDFFVFKP